MPLLPHLSAPSDAPALLATLGTVLSFLLLNVEIADFFAAPGARMLVFEFSGNFARDMTYTIAWAVFALALLLASFRKNLRFGRYAALALLGVALLKLFLHDLARLEALYRIGALFGVVRYRLQFTLPCNSFRVVRGADHTAHPVPRRFFDVVEQHHRTGEESEQGPRASVPGPGCEVRSGHARDGREGREARACAPGGSILLDTGQRGARFGCEGLTAPARSLT